MIAALTQLLGPATVALAVPLYVQFRRVRAMLVPAIVGLLVGSVVAAVSAVLVARLFGASLATQRTASVPRVPFRRASRQAPSPRWRWA